MWPVFLSFLSHEGENAWKRRHAMNKYVFQSMSENIKASVTLMRRCSSMKT